MVFNHTYLLGISVGYKLGAGEAVDLGGRRVLERKTEVGQPHFVAVVLERQILDKIGLIFVRDVTSRI